jgi:hypothetical protein
VHPIEPLPAAAELLHQACATAAPYRGAKLGVDHGRKRFSEVVATASEASGENAEQAESAKHPCLTACNANTWAEPDRAQRYDRRRPCLSQGRWPARYADVLCCGAPAYRLGAWTVPCCGHTGYKVEFSLMVHAPNASPTRGSGKKGFQGTG